MSLLLIEILMVARGLLTITFGTLIWVDVCQLVWQVLVALPSPLLFFHSLQY